MSVEPAVDELIIGQLSLLEEVFEGAEQTQRIVRELRHQRLLHLASLIVLSLPPVNDQVVTIKLDVTPFCQAPGPGPGQVQSSPVQVEFRSRSGPVRS